VSDRYHIWCDLRDSSRDLEFCRDVDAWLGHLTGVGAIEGWRIGRRKLGLGPPDIGEFHIEIAVRDLAQLDEAFHAAARRTGDAESLHGAVFRAVRGVRFALYRDFPDPERR
jgi:uncharacterized protein DUF6614